MKKRFRVCGFMLALSVLAPSWIFASSHMDAPLITLDDAANTTDVYAWVGIRPDGTKVLTTALSVYPHEEPGIGPNKYNFDDNVLYEIHIAAGNDLLEYRTPFRPSRSVTYSYQFEFTTKYKTTNSILQSYLGVIENVDDSSQNLTQTYKVTQVNNRNGKKIEIGTGIVPPNNQGIATPYYNRDNDGEKPARDGVATTTARDRYTSQTVYDFSNGYRVFAGQREDGFYGDIQAIFDLLSLRGAGKAQDSQGGFNVHTMVLQIPVTEFGGDMQSVGVYATTSRRKTRVLNDDNDEDKATSNDGAWVQVGRQGNPLFCEALVAIKDKDLYNRTRPSQDRARFGKYAENPELATLINLLLFGGKKVADDKNRTDIAGIFIPDMIMVDLSTDKARLAGGGPNHATTPDDAGFSRLGIFGNDVLTSKIQPGFGGGTIPGGWPNGRRFGDDVIDIAVTALLSDLRVNPPVIASPAGDNVDQNDAVYNKVFPYAGTPHNGRNHSHP